MNDWNDDDRRALRRLGRFAIVLVVIGVPWIYVQEARQNEALAKQRPPVVSPAEYAAASFTLDSASACTDSALLAQHRVEPSVAYRMLADMREPRVQPDDSTWLAWRHRRMRLEAGETPSEVYAGYRSCEDHARR